MYKKLMESGHCRAEDVAIITPHLRLTGVKGLGVRVTGLGFRFQVQGGKKQSSSSRQQ